MGCIHGKELHVYIIPPSCATQHTFVGQVCAYSRLVRRQSELYSVPIYTIFSRPLAQYFDWQSAFVPRPYSTFARVSGTHHTLMACTTHETIGGTGESRQGQDFRKYKYTDRRWLQYIQAHDRWFYHVRMRKVDVSIRSSFTYNQSINQFYSA
jgi:hypothetical protein